MRDLVRNRKLWRLLGLALLLRLMLLAALAWRNPGGLENGDTPGYWLLAENLRTHGVFSRQAEPPYLPDALRTPGFPAFLVPLQAAGLGKAGIAAVEVLVALLVLVLTHRWTGEFLGEPQARVAALLIAVDPVSILYAVTVAPEVLLTLLLVVAALLASRGLRWEQAALVGVTCGLAAWVKPMALYLGPWMAALWALDGKKAGRVRYVGAAVVLTAATVTVLPWFVRNYRTFGVWRFTSIQGYNLLYYNAAVLESARTGVPVSQAQDQLSRELAQYLPPTLERNELRDAVAMEKLALKKILASPFLYALLHLRGVPTSLLDPGRIEWARVLGLPNPHWGFLDALSTRAGGGPWRLLGQLPALQLVLMAAYFVALLAVGAFVVLGTCRLCGSRGWRGPLLWLWGPLLYQLLVIGPIGGARFRVSMWPFVAPLAAAGLVAACKGEPSRPPSHPPKVLSRGDDRSLPDSGARQ